MGSCMLEAIVQIRTHLIVIPKRMLQRFCDNMYKAASLPSTDNDFQESDFIWLEIGLFGPRSTGKPVRYESQIQKSRYTSSYIFVNSNL